MVAIAEKILSIILTIKNDEGVKNIKFLILRILIKDLMLDFRLLH